MHPTGTLYIKTRYYRLYYSQTGYGVFRLVMKMGVCNNLNILFQYENKNLTFYSKSINVNKENCKIENCQRILRGKEIVK